MPQGKIGIEDLGQELKTKINKTIEVADNVENGEFSYVHPNDSQTRHVTDLEKANWNNKADKTIATDSEHGLMSNADKIKLNNIAINANNYIHPETHQASMISIADQNNLFTATDVEGALKEVFTNASNGKTAIANAITGKGGTANANMTFQQLANAIANTSTLASGSWAYLNGFDDLTHISGNVVVKMKISNNNMYGLESASSPKAVIYNLQTNKWTIRSVSAFDTSASTLCVITNNLIGLGVNSTGFNYITHYNFSSNTKTVSSVQLIPIHFNHGEAVGNKVYTVGGRRSNDASTVKRNFVYEYDITGMTMTQKQDTTVTFNKPLYCAVGNDLYVAEGDNTDSHHYFFKFNTQTNTWTQISLLPPQLATTTITIKFIVYNPKTNSIHFICRGPANFGSSSYDSSHIRDFECIYNITQNTWGNKKAFAKGIEIPATSAITYHDNKIFSYSKEQGMLVSYLK